MLRRNRCLRQWRIPVFRDGVQVEPDAEAWHVRVMAELYEARAETLSPTERAPVWSHLVTG